MSSTQFAYGETFDVSQITVGAPIKSTDSNKYWTFPIKYCGAGFGIMENETCNATKVKDDPQRKPGMLTQGFHVSNPKTRAIAEQAENAIFEGLLKHTGADKDFPSFFSTAEKVEDFKAAAKFIKLKGILHRPCGKDKSGKPTKIPDPTVNPLIYGKLIQCGDKHPETPFKVFSKYYDVRVLTPQVRAAIKEGTDKEENYLIPAQELWKKKVAFTCKWSLIVADVYLCDTILKIRKSVTEVWIVSFATAETVATKNMADIIAKTGEQFEGPKLVIPSAVVEDDSDHDEGSDDGEVVRQNIPPVAANPQNKYDVVISTGDN